MGEPREVADRYLEINFARDPQVMASSAHHRGGDGDARIVEVWVEDEQGERKSAVPQGRRICLKALVRFAVDAQDPEASLYVLNDEHKAILVATTASMRERSGHYRAGAEVLFSFSFHNVLAPGRYSPLFTLGHGGTGLDLMDRFEGTFSFVVTGPEAMGGLVDLPVEVSIARAPSSLSQRVGA
jgi:hypothetical protein